MAASMFCDVSQWNPAIIDWQAYKSWSAQGDGVSRVAMRSTYGLGYVDTHFQTYREAALNAGIDSIIFYHYSYPQWNAAVAEANWQRQIVGDIRAQDFIVLDFEENVNAATSVWAYTWLATQEANYGRLPGLYASSAYISQRLQDPRLARYPLWEANWQFSPDERPPVPYPWKTRAFLQFTDRAVSIPGIPGVVDCNIFLGNEEEPTMPQIDLTNPKVAQYFKANGAAWQCLKTGFLIGGGMLGLYQKFGGDALCGLTYLGLPQSGEISVPGHPGVTVQEFERGCLRWDPGHVIDSPPWAGSVYTVHVEQDPRNVAIQAQVSKLQTQNSLLQSQVADLQNQLAGNTLAQENAALLARIAQAQKDLQG